MRLFPALRTYIRPSEPNLTSFGPDTPALGVRENVETTQSQVAGTIAQLLGEDFAAASVREAPDRGVRDFPSCGMEFSLFREK